MTGLKNLTNLVQLVRCCQPVCALLLYSLPIYR